MRRPIHVCRTFTVQSRSRSLRCATARVIVARIPRRIPVLYRGRFRRILSRKRFGYGAGRQCSPERQVAVCSAMHGRKTKTVYGRKSRLVCTRAASSISARFLSTSVKFVNLPSRVVTAGPCVAPESRTRVQQTDPVCRFFL